LKSTQIYLLLLLSFIQLQSFAGIFVLDNNANCAQIYKDISAFQIPKASIGILEELKKNPTNVFPVVLANYIDFYELFLNENPIQYQLRKPNEEKRIDAIDFANDNTAYYLHSKAVIYLQWSLVKLKFKDYFSATKDARKAYHLFVENKKKFPAFDGGDTYLGSLQAVIGSIPNNYKWMASVLGMKGNLQVGSALIQNAVISNTNPFKADALFAYIYLKQYLQNEPNVAWTTLKKRRTECVSNRFLTFLTVNIAINSNKAEEVIGLLQDNVKNSQFMDIPILDYELGCAYFYKLDKKAFVYFNNYLNNFKGKFYRKDAYYKMALLAYLQDNNTLANQYAKLIEKQANSDADADKHAQQFAEDKNWPSKDLLKIRCLYDGGYFTKALEIANKMKVNREQELEYHYRIARIYDETKITDSAVFHYNKAIELGRFDDSYFAARASLQLGMFYENINKKQLAKQCFTQSMNLRNIEYKNSIDMRAKAGLQRLEGK
jgi:hypothetical protein